MHELQVFEGTVFPYYKQLPSERQDSEAYRAKGNRWRYFGIIPLHCKYLTTVASRSKIPPLLLFNVDLCSIFLC